jgi:hypothetical protein
LVCRTLKPHRENARTYRRLQRTSEECLATAHSGEAFGER